MASGETFDFVIIEKQQGQRLDLFLVEQLCITRSQAHRLIDGGAVMRLKGKVKAAHILKVGEQWHVTMPELREPTSRPQDIAFDVLWHDDALAVVNKPAGLAVHPGAGRPDGTLVNGLLHRFPQLRGRDSLRPGIVHRLDLGTSGLLVVALQDRTLHLLQKAFHDRQVEKDYLALCIGSVLPEEGEVEQPIGRDPRNRLKMAVCPSGRSARTTFKRLWTYNRRSLVVCRPHTGRTHQIRVHMKCLGCYLDGDRLYGPNDPQQHLLEDRVFLHAWRLAFKHPLTGEDLRFRQPLPAELLHVIGQVQGGTV